MLLRRWYFALPLLLATLVAAVLVTGHVKPEYSAVGHLQMIPPAVVDSSPANVNKIRNPWATLGVAALGQAAIIKVTDPAVLDTLASGGYSGDVTIALDETVLVISVTGTTPGQATRTVQRIMVLLQEAIHTQQQEYRVPVAESISALALDDGSKVTVVSSKVNRAAAGTAGAGLLLMIGCTVGLDALLRRRALKRSGAAPTSPKEPSVASTRPTSARAGATLGSGQPAVATGGPIGGDAARAAPAVVDYRRAREKRPESGPGRRTPPDVDRSDETIILTLSSSSGDEKPQR